MMTKPTGYTLFTMLARLERLPVAARKALALAGAVVIAVLDWWSGFELSLAVVYLAPIAFAAWAVNRTWGLLLAVLCAFLGLAADTAAGIRYSLPLVGAWNALIRLTSYTIIVMLLAALQRQLSKATFAARTDALTGVYTRRYAFELLERELIRSYRYGHTLALAYLDVDDFKDINDRFGHEGGDEVLRAVAGALQSASRDTDVVARIGGDEFLLALPETDEVAAAALLERLSEAATQAASAIGRPVTVSVGCMCFGPDVVSVKVAVQAVDAIMYEVKNAGKGRVKVLSGA